MFAKTLLHNAAFAVQLAASSNASEAGFLGEALRAPTGQRDALVSTLINQDKVQTNEEKVLESLKKITDQGIKYETVVGEDGVTKVFGDQKDRFQMLLFPFEQKVLRVLNEKRADQAQELAIYIRLHGNVTKDAKSKTPIKLSNRLAEKAAVPSVDVSITEFESILGIVKSLNAGKGEQKKEVILLLAINPAEPRQLMIFSRRPNNDGMTGLLSIRLLDHKAWNDVGFDEKKLEALLKLENSNELMNAKKLEDKPAAGEIVSNNQLNFSFGQKDKLSVQMGSARPEPKASIETFFYLIGKDDKKQEFIPISRVLLAK